MPSDSGVSRYVMFMKLLLWNISVASERRFGSVKMFRELNCPKSRLTAQKKVSKNSIDALNIRSLSRLARCTVEKVVDGGLVKVVGRLEFPRTKEVVKVEAVSRLL